MGLSFLLSREETMNLLYYNAQIKEELEDAAAYIKKACCLKSSNSSKAERYAKLGQEELTHAKALLEMFEEDYSEEVKHFDIVPTFYTDVHKSMIDMYLEFHTQAELMLRAYSEK